MDGVNKTLYIPLYGKAFVSKKGILLQDTKAEAIWEQEGFALKGKSKSKWLAYYMGMRAAVFDRWLKKRMSVDGEAIILHIGCGLDSRILRVGTGDHPWYDVDFPDVIKERKKYYEETAVYHMISGDARETEWIRDLPAGKSAIVILEGISMYLQPRELERLLQTLQEHFVGVKVLMDCYTEFAAKASKYKNPIRDVGVTEVVGMERPQELAEKTGLTYIGERSMTPKRLIEELKGMERLLFRALFAGTLARKMYRLYEFQA